MASTETGWTTVEPTENGYYWWRQNAEDAEPYIHRVEGDGFYEIASLVREDVAGYGGEWLPASPSDAEQLMELRRAATAALEAFRYMRDVDPQHWDFHVTPEICTAWDKLRAALNPSHLQQETQ